MSMHQKKNKNALVSLTVFLPIIQEKKSYLHWLQDLNGFLQTYVRATEK